MTLDERLKEILVKHREYGEYYQKDDHALLAIKQAVQTELLERLPKKRLPSEMLGWTDKDVVRDIRNEIKGYNKAIDEVEQVIKGVK